MIISPLKYFPDLQKLRMLHRSENLVDLTILPSNYLENLKVICQDTTPSE